MSAMDASRESGSVSETTWPPAMALNCRANSMVSSLPPLFDKGQQRRTSPNDAEVAVQRLHRMHERGLGARAGQRGGRLLRHQAALAEASDDEDGIEVRDQLDSLDEGASKQAPSRPHRRSVLVQHASCSFNQRGGHGRHPIKTTKGLAGARGWGCAAGTLLRQSVRARLLRSGCCSAPRPCGRCRRPPRG